MGQQIENQHGAFDKGANLHGCLSSVACVTGAQGGKAPWSVAHHHAFAPGISAAEPA